MSLRCVETGKPITWGDVLMAANIPETEFFSALSVEAIGGIPPHEYRRYRATRADGGINIYSAHSYMDSDGYYSLDGFKSHQFAFSITKEAATKYLPNLVGRRERRLSVA